jgi:FkbM family methyltransferase
LELGGNIGRNSLIIASILENPCNLVVLESDPKSASTLKRNSELNSLPFQVVSAALSAEPLIQKAWLTKPGSVENSWQDFENGWFEVSTVTWKTLKSEFPIDFTVLVVDCEGAFFPILRDFPQVIDGIRLVLLENDFSTKDEASWVHDFLRARGFKDTFRTTYPNAWGPCKDFFWQAWERS